MKRGRIPVKEFSAALERHLPRIEDLHDRAREAGFAAWEGEQDALLDLVDPDQRPREREIMLLCCREEMCSFSRYSKNLGGDGVELEELAELRARAKRRSADRSDGAPTYLQSFNEKMWRDRSLSQIYAKRSRERTAKRMVAERARYRHAVARTVAQDAKRDVGSHAKALLGDLLSANGFSPEREIGGTFAYAKELNQCGRVHLCIGDFDAFATEGWLGDLEIAFLLETSFDFAERDALRPFAGKALLPLRIAALAPGLSHYASGRGLFRTDTFETAAADVVILHAFGDPTSEAVSDALAHLALAVDCHLWFFAGVEAAVARACDEVARTTER